MEIIMSGCALSNSFGRCMEKYSVTTKSKCKVAIAKGSIEWHELAREAGYHRGDIPAEMKASLEYKRMEQCLADKHLCQPEWYEFFLTPSGKYVVAFDMHRVVAIKLKKKIVPTKKDLKWFKYFREGVRDYVHRIQEQIPQFKATVKELSEYKRS